MKYPRARVFKALIESDLRTSFYRQFVFLLGHLDMDLDGSVLAEVEDEFCVHIIYRDSGCVRAASWLQ